MHIPVKQLYPISLEPSSSQVLEIEAQLPVLPLMNPRIFALNASASEVSYSLDHILDLGTSSDPLLNGTFTTNLVSTTISSAELLAHVFVTTALDAGISRHRLTLNNTSAATVIVHVWLEGVFEESLKQSPNFLPITL